MTELHVGGSTPSIFAISISSNQYLQAWTGNYGFATDWGYWV